MVSLKIKALCGCRDTHCCPRDSRDRLDRPARHAIYQRARKIERLNAVPQSVRSTAPPGAKRWVGDANKGTDRAWRRLGP